MIRSMMSPTDLPFTFWGYALETAAFTLNRVPSKEVEKTPKHSKDRLLFVRVWILVEGGRFSEMQHL